MNMKTRSAIYWVTAIIVVFLIAILLWRWKNTFETPSTRLDETNATPSAMGQTLTQATNAISKSQVASNMMPAPNQPRTLPAVRDKVAILTAVLNANDADIVFYGRLEDQFSNTVHDAEVDFNVQFENASDRGIKRGQVVSDGSGLFTISGYRGANLTLMPKKPGYALATNSTSFRYSQISPGFFVPDANNPTVIKMWKLQGPEPLTSINQHYKLPYASAPMNFDLLTGQIVPSGGDLKITVSRPPGVISGLNRLDWSVQIEAVDGGLMDSGDQEGVTYWAPESGYQPSITLAASTNGHGVELIQEGLFVQSRNGEVYSKIGLSFRINSDPDGFMNIAFNGVANTNGSRNWEATVPQ